jgi:hypothetical protein
MEAIFFPFVIDYVYGTQSQEHEVIQITTHISEGTTLSLGRLPTRLLSTTILPYCSLL